MDEIDFSRDDFSDLTAKDHRYHARAYALLMDVVLYLTSDGRHCNAESIMTEFKERTLDQYGPLAYTVLLEWGVKSCEDLGEMMFNLADSHRVHRDEDDTPDSFLGGYDFRETFLGPYAV